MNKRNGWLWVPSLYLYQGIPYSIVMTTSALIYKTMGVSVASFAMWTSLLYLPWTIKPLWSPVVEAVSTKRRWVVATQLLVAVAFVVMGLVMQMPLFYPLSLLVMAVVAFGSASHDIACDGFYMLALDKHDQSFFVGIRTTFYRIAMLSALGLLPQLAGYVQEQTGMEPLTIEARRSSAASAIGNGVVTATCQPTDSSYTLVLQPDSAAFLPATFTLALSGADAKNYSLSTERITLVSPSDEARIEVSVHKNTSPQSVMQMQVSSGNIALGWTVALAALGVFLLLLTLWNGVALPHPSDSTAAEAKGGAIYIDVIRSFFSKPGVVPAVAFMLLYRLGEAQLSKIATPFLIDDRANGGLALSMTQYGWIYGTAGMVALTVGGVAGGWLASRYGLKRVIWYMVALMNLPNLVYVALAHFQPMATDWTVSAAIVAEQAGYGFGFTAYMLFLLHYVGDSKYKTAEYAIGTTLMALGMMLPGMVSGYMNEMLGYEWFFVYVVLCCLPGTLLVRYLKLD